MISPSTHRPRLRAHLPVPGCLWLSTSREYIAVHVGSGLTSPWPMAQ